MDFLIFHQIVIQYDFTNYIKTIWVNKCFQNRILYGFLQLKLCLTMRSKTKNIYFLLKVYVFGVQVYFNHQN